MNRKTGISAILLAVAWASMPAGAEPPACPAPAPFMTPAVFGSQAEAQAFAKSSFAGGHVQQLNAAGRAYLAVHIHGSGFPVIATALYREQDGRWVRVVETGGFGAVAFDASVWHGMVVMGGEHAAPHCVLFSPVAEASACATPPPGWACKPRVDEHGTYCACYSESAPAQCAAPPGWVCAAAADRSIEYCSCFPPDKNRSTGTAPSAAPAVK
ncbi:MAG TPA: hypothetical protein VIU46_03495 [Gallionellaceae bacterium]